MISKAKTKLIKSLDSKKERDEKRHLSALSGWDASAPPW